MEERELGGTDGRTMCKGWLHRLRPQEGREPVHLGFGTGGGGVGPEQVGALAFSEEPGRSERMPANLGAGFCIRLTKCSQTC